MIYKIIYDKIIYILFKYKFMIFDFLRKQKKITEKVKIIKIMVISLNIPDKQKELYLETINILSIDWLDKLYITLSNFTRELENEELEKINKYNFSEIAWMRKKEAEDKQKEINSFSFLINNL